MYSSGAVSSAQQWYGVICTAVVRCHMYSSGSVICPAVVRRHIYSCGTVSHVQRWYFVTCPAVVRCYMSSNFHCVTCTVVVLCHKQSSGTVSHVQRWDGVIWTAGLLPYGHQDYGVTWTVRLGCQMHRSNTSSGQPWGDMSACGTIVET